MVNKDLGVSHHGMSDWYWQRFSAIVLMFLLPWVFILLLTMYFGWWTQVDILSFLNQAWVKLLHSILLWALLLHAFLGLKVVLEDYVHQAGMRVTFVGFLQLILLVFGVWWLAVIWGWV